jgi:hypothetical protein
MQIPRLTAAGFLLLFLTSHLRAADPPPTLLGALTAVPTSERPVGWRGDGTGRFPGADPPTAWQREQTGKDQKLTNISWMTALPNVGVSSPIVVGDKIFLTCEPADVVCIDKPTGKILWMRSVPEFEAVSQSVRDADPAYAEKLTPLGQELDDVDNKMVVALNDIVPAGSGVRPDHFPLMQKKRDIEKEIIKEETRIDKKRFTHNWAQVIFGYTGATPTSDGERVYAFLTTGVTVCFDLQGNRKWIAGGEGGGSEHGNFASPLLIDDRLVVWANELRAYDKLTGELKWTTPAKAFNTYGSLFGLKSGGESVACYQWGFFTRVKDGSPIWDKDIFGDSVTTPIVEAGKIFAWVGYPQNDPKKKGFKAFPVPADTHSGKLDAAYGFDTEWGSEEMPVDDKKNPFDRYYVCSPLYVDGLIYQVNQGGGLFVNDAATGAQVYRKVLPLHPRTEYWNWAGCGASPTLAGKYIYLYDNQGTTIVIRPGRTYDQVAINTLDEFRENKEREQNLATPVFDGKCMYYRTPGYLYCIGGK